MISRSSTALALAAGLSVLASPSLAQDPVQVGGQESRIHVVQEGETLWGLAQLYMGDPLLWPEIYRLNTQVIEDPHWIFPGEALALGGGQPAPAPVEPAAPEPEPAEPLPEQQQAVQAEMQAPLEAAPPEEEALEAPAVEAAPVLPPPPPADAGAPTVFARRTVVEDRPSLSGTRPDVFRYRPVRRGDFYSAGFLTEDAGFAWADVLGDVDDLGSRSGRAMASAMMYSEVTIRPPAGATYRVGDSLLVANLSREVRNWGQVVVPAGVVRVSHAAADGIRAEVVMQFGRVVDGQVAIPIERFNDPGFTTPTPVSNGATGSVIGVRDLHPVPNQQDIVFIDLGRAAGVVLGDVFEILDEGDPQTGAPPERTAIMQVVHVRDQSASALIMQVYRPGVTPGQTVRLVRKMPA